MHMHQYHTRELFRQLAEGDETAFRTVFYEYNARLFPFINKVTQSEENAREIAQEVFLRLWLHREAVSKLEYPPGWLFKVAANLALSYLRKIAAEERRLQVLATQMPELEDAVTNTMDAKETNALIEQAITSLPEKRQQIFRLSRQEKLSHQQIADQLGISANTVKNQLVMALKQVQEYLQRLSDCMIPLFILEILFS